MSIPLINTGEPTARERLEGMIRAAKADLAANIAQRSVDSPAILSQLFGQGDIVTPATAAERISSFAIALSEAVVGNYSPKDLV